MTDVPTTMRQIRSLVTDDGTLRVTIDDVAVPTPRDDQVLIRVEASPINPSDLGVLFGVADLHEAEVTGPADRPVVTVPLPDAGLRAMAGRIGQPVAAGNEGAGTVVAAGASPEAQALVGATVAALGGAMYAEHRVAAAADCLRLPDGVSPAEGASCFVNPLTALGMAGTMRLEGHTALVHTAAASNLGQMLNRLCQADGIGLVNIVRRAEQADLLQAQGAEHVCDSSAPTFQDDLVEALVATGATLAFDAVGGGDLASRILSAMETAINATSGAGYNRYGSNVHKQVYVYGSLDRGPVTIRREFGMAWGVGGWLLIPFLARVGPEETQRLRERVAAEITTTFASTYTDQVGLAEALSLDAIRAYGQQATGQKFLITPQA